MQDHRWPAQYLAAIQAGPWAGLWSEEQLLLRSSTVGSAELCFGRALLAGEAGFDHVTSEAMFFGTVEHALAEQALIGIAPPVSTRFAVWQIAEALADADSLPLGDLLPAGDQRQRWCDDLLRLHGAWRTWWEQWCGQWAQVVVKVTEMPLVAPMRDLTGEVAYWIAGTPDGAVEVTTRAGEPFLIGLDWKTASRGWDKGKGSASYQHQMYSILIRRILGMQVDHWLYVVGDRSKTQWQVHPAESTPQARLGVSMRLDALAEMIQNGTEWFTPRDTKGKRGWHCKPTYCGAWPICQARFLGDEYDPMGRTGTGWENYT
jgi:hypothetical protein